METLIPIIAAALASMVAALTGLSPLGRFLSLKRRPEKPYTERLSELTASLMEASSEVDSVLAELAKVAKDRQESVQHLESDLASLEQREKELKQRIEALENVPIPVAEHFAMLVKPGETRNARRDYLLFGAGVVMTAVLTIIIRAIIG